MADRPTTVRCSGVRASTPHGPHNWTAQPGMDPVRCPGTGDAPTAPRLDVLIDRACRHLTGDEGAALRAGWAELGAALTDATSAMKEARETNERARAEMKYAGEVLDRAGRCEATLRAERGTYRAAWHSARDRARKTTEQRDRARRWAIHLENENRRLEDHAKEAKEQARIATVAAYNLKLQTPDAAQRTLDRVRHARTWCDLWVQLGMYYGLKPEECGLEARGRRTTAERIAEDRAAELGRRLEQQRERAERAEQQAARVRATLAEVLAQFTHNTHPGQPCKQTGHVSVETIDRWRAVLAPSAYCGSRATHSAHPWQDYAQPRHCPGHDAALDAAGQPDCPACEAGIEHDVCCPTPETHNHGCTCTAAPSR